MLWPFHVREALTVAFSYAATTISASEQAISLCAWPTP